MEVAISPLKTSEWQLARQLYATLKPTDVVVADSAYGTYTDLALVRSAHADAVFRKHYRRRCDFRRGKKLGIGDHIVWWQRPPCCPQSMSRTEFDSLPMCMEVREVHLLIQQPGFRPQQLILVTTLLDSQRYAKRSLAQLYQLRWQATEVNSLASQNDLENGDDCGQNSGDGAKGYLGAFAGLQFAANFNVAIGSAHPGSALAH